METKKEIRYFSIFNHEKEEKYLREMHKSGWRLVRISGLCVFHFEKCEPEDVIYQLDYNPQTDDTRAEYLQMFSDCGWEHVQDYAGYSYFRKSSKDGNTEDKIFSDCDSYTAMMARVFNKRIYPLVFIFLLAVIPNFVLGIFNHDYIVTSIFGAIILVYITLFIACAVCYRKMKKK